MSIYGTVQTEIKDIELLCRVLDELKLDYVHDPNGQLDYHMWNRPKSTRGRDATVVIGRLNGGLDTTKARYCGDTAFVQEADGSFRAEIDIAHNNAPANWQAVQNLYAVKLAEEALPRGFDLKYTLDRETGHISGQVIPAMESAVGVMSRGGLSR
jgi:hypothetical protein